jgi:hypothetical protein
MHENLSIERELEHAGMPVFAWNEPIKLDGGRAQLILQRRINQSVAEYEVFNSLEMSRGGLCTHVREGWNIGKPPYGYKAKKYRHPNPAKAARGHTKTRLEPDGARAETVTQIAAWRHHEQLGYGEIADRLNADPDKYPVPEPPGGLRARGAWSKSTVADLDALPYLTANLRDAPQPLLARLYEATQLRIDLHPDTREATIMIKLPADHIDAVTDAAHATAAGPTGGGVTDAGCAPGRNRTCDTRFRKPTRSC